MTKVGDKYIIEIDSVMTNKHGNLYGVKGFRSLVFDEEGLDRLDKVNRKEDEWKIGDIFETTPDEIGRNIGILTSAYDSSRINILWNSLTCSVSCDSSILDDLDTKYLGNVWDMVVSQYPTYP